MIRSYLSLAWKVLLRRKFFTFISLFGISFTLVVLLVVTALLDHVVAAYPPETRHDRTVGIFYARMTGEHWSRNGFAGYALMRHAAEGLPNVERTGLASMPEAVYSYVNGQRIKSWMKRTDAGFWQILDFQFVEGGPFTAADVDGHRKVAVINETTRQRFFGGRTALGRTLEVDGQQFTVVGVVPDVSILRIVPFADVWTPHTTAKSDDYTREWIGNFMGILLLKDPARVGETRDEFRSRIRAEQAAALPKGFTNFEATPETLFDTVGRTLVGGSESGIGYGDRLRIALAIAALLFMLLPAVNLVNLNASRIMERASEIGVRKSFGASSRALVLQFVIENLFLTLIGAAIGLVLAGAALATINASGLILYAQLSLNYRIFAWAVVFAVAFGLLSGVYPAWRMSRLHPVQALKGTPR